MLRYKPKPSLSIT